MTTIKNVLRKNDESSSRRNRKVRSRVEKMEKLMMLTEKKTNLWKESENLNQFQRHEMNEKFCFKVKIENQQRTNHL